MTASNGWTVDDWPIKKVMPIWADAIDDYDIDQDGMNYERRMATLEAKRIKRMCQNKQGGMKVGRGSMTWGYLEERR